MNSTLKKISFIGILFFMSILCACSNTTSTTCSLDQGYGINTITIGYHKDKDDITDIKITYSSKIDKKDFKEDNAFTKTIKERYGGIKGIKITTEYDEKKEIYGSSPLRVGKKPMDLI